MTDPNVREQMKDFGGKMYSLRQTDLVSSHRFPPNPPAYKIDFKSAVIYKMIQKDVPLFNHATVSKSSFFIESKTFLRPSNGFKQEFVVYFQTNTGKYI